MDLQKYGLALSLTCSVAVTPTAFPNSSLKTALRLFNMVCKSFFDTFGAAYASL